MIGKKNLDILTAFTKEALATGKNYFAAGFVINLKIDCPSEDTIISTSKVIDPTKKNPCDVNLAIKIANDKIDHMNVSCSCKATYCKHEAATILATFAKLTQDLSEDQKQAQKLEDHWNLWLSQEEITIKPPPSNLWHIVYIIKLSSFGVFPKLEVDVKKSRILKSGQYGAFQKISIEGSAWANSASEGDAYALLNLKKHSKDTFPPFQLEANQSGAVLEKILATKKAFFQHENHAQVSKIPLQLGHPRDYKLTWKLLENGKQQLECSIEKGGELLPTSPSWFLDQSQNECGPLRMVNKSDSAAIKKVLTAPLVGPNEVPFFQKFLRKTNLPIPKPTSLDIEKTSFSPKLRFKLFGLDQIERFCWKGSDKIYPLIDFSFVYGDMIINPLDERQTFYQSKGVNQLTQVTRNLTKEKKLLKDIVESNNVAPLSVVYPSQSINPSRDFWTFRADAKKQPKEKTAAQIAKIVHQWKKEGIMITIDATFPYPLLIENYDWYLDAAGKDQSQWFDIDLGIKIDGKKINLLPTLVSLIQEHPNIFHPQVIDQLKDDQPLCLKLADGRLAQLPAKKIKHILSSFCELADPLSLTSQKLKIPRIRASELLNFDDEWEKGKECKEFAQTLKNFSGIKKAPKPKNLKATLRPYQKEGVSWLQFLEQYKLGGILADDMGLGKTVQTLTHLVLEKEKNPDQLPSLIVAPTSVIANWEEELNRFTPTLHSLTLTGPKRAEIYDLMSSCDVVFTTYPLLVRDYEKLLEKSFHAVILDEAQAIKNPASKCSKICRQLKANHKICLTGTPVENNLGELWSLFDFACPGMLGTKKQFNHIFRTPIEKTGSMILQKNLGNRINPFLLRRTKDKVAKELPQKTEIIQTIEIEGDQKEFYEGIRLSMHEKVKQSLQAKGLASSQILILDALLKLRQVCCDPRLLQMESAKKVTLSAKFSFLTQMLTSLLQEKRKILLFSSFTSMLSLIENHLTENKISYAKLTGQTKDRKEQIDAFQNGNRDIFLISLKAGGVGLNLTAADTVIIYDPWWNPAAEQQAIDRAYRIGQDKPIFVYKLIMKQTVEEKILKMQQRKLDLIRGVFDQKQNKPSKMTLEDVEHLFEPLTPHSVSSR